MSDVMADRRGATRFTLVLVVEILHTATGLRLNARTSDLSRTGCYVDTLTPLPVNSLVTLRMTRNSEILELTGKVAYISPGLGMGVAFTDPLYSPALAILERWLLDAARSSF